MADIRTYQLEDARRDLWALAFLNLFLAFCIVAPDIGHITLDYHLGVLLLQSLLLFAYLYRSQLRTRMTTLIIFASVLVTTVHEVVVWVGQLDGTVNNIGSGKGAPFAFLFQSPPYLYPVIRVGSLLLSLPILRTLVPNVRKGTQKLSKR